MSVLRARLFASSVLGSWALLGTIACPAWAGEQQVSPPESIDETAQLPVIEEQAGKDIVITGSRIRTSDTTTPAPVTIVNPTVIKDRGFTQIGQALNELPSITLDEPRNTGIGAAITVQTFPNLFNLGSGRTLSLVNGRRMVTTASGLEDAAVDTNIIPTGLVERVDVVQAGGAAVYGSGAMAGVINYVMKRNFEGVELDAQTSITSRGDYPVYSLRGTFGKNFASGRGNFAVNVDYSKSDPLRFTDRERSAQAPFAGTNPANGTVNGNNDGIPATIYFNNTKTWSSSYNGIFWANTGTGLSSLLRMNGSPVEFNDAGTGLIPYDPGNVVFSNLAIGGGGVDYNSKSSLFAGIERLAGTAIASYELTPNIRVSTELLYASTHSMDPLGRMRPMQFDNTGSAAGGTFSFAVYRDNAFLSPETVAQLSAASPSFAAGGPLYFGKFADNIMPDTNVTTDLKTYRGVIAVDGDFSMLGGRNFDWSLSYSRARVTGHYDGWNLNQIRMRNAADAVTNSAGQIVCRINAVTITDPNCAPLNLFGRNNISDAAQDYVIVKSGRNQSNVFTDFVNDQSDLLASLGGDLLDLPGGTTKFNVTYERRTEKVETTPLEADRLGLVGSGAITPAIIGKYSTNEFAGELLIPLLGGDFSLPLVDALEVNGSYRIVDDSLAGRENVWGLGVRWDVVRGLTIRSSLSRNYRAPNLNQLLAPATTEAATANNPCSNASIANGSNPTARYANCLALFTENPTFGAISGNPGASPAARLAGFFDFGSNFRRVLVTTGGNPDLENETSRTFTIGLVFQPAFVPGLTFTADRIRLNLRDALSNFTATSFLATCYDSPSRPADICSTFTYNPDGTLATATATTYNAGFLTYHGEIYNLNYRFNIGQTFGSDSDLGNLSLSVQATHNTLRVTSVTGLDLLRTDNTTDLPGWVIKPEMTYSRGPFRLNYSVYYLPAEKMNYTDTVENQSVLPVEANVRHNISMAYEVDPLTFRVGVNNLTDEAPSYPYSANYGDIVGRQFFFGIGASF